MEFKGPPPVTKNALAIMLIGMLLLQTRVSAAGDSLSGPVCGRWLEAVPTYNLTVIGTVPKDNRLSYLPVSSSFDVRGSHGCKKSEQPCPTLETSYSWTINATSASAWLVLKPPIKTDPF